LIFEIEQADSSGPYIGASSRLYCWHEDGRPLALDEPTADTPIAGLVAARQLKSINGDILVSIPDGEVIRVRINQIVPRPRGSEADVPLESRSSVGD
jgi:hypothetical protein